MSMVTVVALGCDPKGADDGPEVGLCGEETVTVWTDLDATPPTFERSVSEMLADVEGSYAGSFEWLSEDGFIGVTHAGNTSDLVLDLSYGGGEVRFYEYSGHGQFPGGFLGGIPCSNRIEVDGRLEFSTADGLFAESQVTALYAESIQGDALVLRHPIDFESLAGSLTLDDFMSEEFEVERVDLTGTFPGTGALGSLTVQVIHSEQGYIGGGLVAEFQALAPGANSLCGACESTEFCQFWESVGLDATQSSYSCEPVPEACSTDPSCACISPEVCPNFFVACEDGEVVNLSCAGG